jgi:hypothetical protein
MTSPQDRAAVVATAITTIVAEALRAWLRGGPSSLPAARKEIEKYLRDEFADCARQARGEFELSDD